MPALDEHCRECVRVFGKPYEEVHKWLDEFCGSTRYGMKHRKVRHHEAGIRQVRELFGDQAAQAARQHIIMDITEDGWKEGDHFPQDEQDYIRMGLY